MEREEYRRVRVLIFPRTKFTDNLLSLFTKDLSALTCWLSRCLYRCIQERTFLSTVQQVEVWAPAVATQQRPLWSVSQLVKASVLWEFWPITALLRL